MVSRYYSGLSQGGPTTTSILTLQPSSKHRLITTHIERSCIITGLSLMHPRVAVFCSSYDTSTSLTIQPSTIHQQIMTAFI